MSTEILWNNNSTSQTFLKDFWRLDFIYTHPGLSNWFFFNSHWFPLTFVYLSLPILDKTKKRRKISDKMGLAGTKQHISTISEFRAIWLLSSSGWTDSVGLIFHEGDKYNFLLSRVFWGIISKLLETIFQLNVIL